MNLMQRRPGWRAITAAAVTSLAVLVPAAALAATGGQAAPRAAAVARCASSATYVWLADAPNGAGPVDGYPIEFTNTGTHSCWLAGFPGVAGITASGHTIGPAAKRYGVTAHRVTIKPGQTAHAELLITIKGFITCHNATGAGLAVYAPNQTQRQFVYNFTFAACTNKGYLSVLPVQAGIGVP
jgi:hypothetical protein